MAGSTTSFFLGMVGILRMPALYDTSNDTFIFPSRKGSLMELHQLPPFRLERWFVEFELALAAIPGFSRKD